MTPSHDPKIGLDEDKDKLLKSIICIVVGIDVENLPAFEEHVVVRSKLV